jgi:hypothetical protein
MQVLGPRSIGNTLKYTQLVDFKEDDYIARIAHSEEETCQLIEAGFDSSTTSETTKFSKNEGNHPSQNGRGGI